MKKKFIIYVLLVACYGLRVTMAQAVSPTPISFPTRQSSPAAEEEIEEKIKEIREAVKEKVREKIQEVKKGIPRAYVGEITQITDSTLSLDTRRGLIPITLTSETKIKGIGKQTLELKDLKVGDFCIAMGYLADDGTLEAKRIVIATKPAPPVREVAFGRVSDISSEEKILTVKNERKGLTYTVVVTDKTIITKKVDKRVEKVKFLAIEKGDRIVAIGTPTENEAKLITAKIIHVIPSVSPTPKE